VNNLLGIFSCVVFRLNSLNQNEGVVIRDYCNQVKPDIAQLYSACEFESSR